MDDFSQEKLRGYYLLNMLEKGDRRFKLLLTQTDKLSLLALIEQEPKPTDFSVRIEENFKFFTERIDKLTETELVSLCKGLAKLTIVDVSLDRDHDNPQLVFESMNSTGRGLSQADLIRNFILMGLESEQQTQLYEKYWRRMEILFGQEDYGTHFDKFVRYYLTFKTGELPNIGAVYEVFKNFAHSPSVKVNGVKKLISELYTFAHYYCAMALGKEKDRDLAVVFGDLRELKADVAFPLLLELYNDFALNLLSKKDFIQSVRLVEAYVFRRAACEIPTNSLNKTFATIGRVLEKNNYFFSIQAHLLKLPSYRRFPDDEEFKRELSRRNLYNFSRRSYWLRRLENHQRKEPVSVGEYTIEHIMPQNENLSPAWQEALGSEWRLVQKNWLHTLGNLTLTGYNPEYSDHFFDKKRDMPGGFSESPLKLNQGLGELDTWNEETIQTRANKLAMIATQVWARPEMSHEELTELRVEREPPAGNIVDNQLKLIQDSQIGELFNKFRNLVKTLDPCVQEEVMKECVVYKAETNFVGVVLRKKSLLLLLNISLHELNDPKGLARDAMAIISHLENRVTEVTLENSKNLPYVMGLVRQALEKQMGNEEAGQ